MRPFPRATLRRAGPGSRERWVKRPIDRRTQKVDHRLMATMGPAGILLFTRPADGTRVEHRRIDVRPVRERRPTRETRSVLRELRLLVRRERGKKPVPGDAHSS